MGNHLHLLLEIPDKEKALDGWVEDDFIERLAVLKDEMSTRLVWHCVRSQPTSI